MSHKLIVQTLKQILKTKKINYKQLGEEIGMSESGLKRRHLIKSTEPNCGRGWNLII